MIGVFLALGLASVNSRGYAMKSLLPIFVRSQLVMVVLSVVNPAAMAAGFMLQEQNAVQTGDFGAGGAAIAEDASTNFYNPAGLVRLKIPELVLAANYIQLNTQYSGSVNYINAAAGANTTQQVTDNRGGSGNVIPAFHLAYPLADGLVAGLSLVTPMGLSTNYQSDTYVKYNATKTALNTLDIAPSLGLALTRHWSLGLGADIERLSAQLNNYATFNPADTSIDTDTLSQNKAYAWGYGYHGGVLYQVSPQTRFGLAYHSQVAFAATGNSTFTGPLAIGSSSTPPSYHDNTASVKFRQPANTMLSAYHNFGNAWSLLGTITYTQWDVFKNLNLQNVVVLDPTTFGPGTIDVNLPQNFHNTWRASLGANYRVNEAWLVRAGVGFDQTPTNNADRNLRLPDENRYATSIGAHYQITRMVGLDGGWTHEFIRNAAINNTETEGSQQTTVNGMSKSSADVIGVQLTWHFA